MKNLLKKIIQSFVIVSVIAALFNAPWKKIGKFLLILATPLIVLTVITNGGIVFYSFIVWKEPHSWYFPFTHSGFQMEIDRFFVLLGVILMFILNNNDNAFE